MHLSRSSWLVVGLGNLGIFAAGCAHDDLPPAPALCQQPLTLVTPWRSSTADYDSCDRSPLQTDWLAASNGTVYFATGRTLCAADAQGIRALASTSTSEGSSGFVQGLWVEGDHLIYGDQYRVQVVSSGGGPAGLLMTFSADNRPGAYAYDGTYLYWASEVDPGGTYRAPIAGGAAELLTQGAGAKLRVAGNRLDYFGAARHLITSALTRVTFPNGEARIWDVSEQGDLLDSTAELTYVRYAPSTPPPAGFVDANFHLGVIDSGDQITDAWTGPGPQLMPTAATVHGGTLYAGGRLHYHDGAVFVGVTATPVGATVGKVLGCSPTSLAAGQQWDGFYAMAADDDAVYGIVSQSKPGLTQYAIARFAAR